MDAFSKCVADRATHSAIELAGEPYYNYIQIDSVARSLAVSLLRAGASAESVIGISIPKSPEYIAAMLGIWYAGCAFVPLDPSLPADRLELMVRECAIKLNIVAPDVSSGITSFADVQQIPVTSDLNEAKATFTYRPVDDRSLAYVIFTSGSTGKPKGVLVSHSGIVSLLRAQISAFALDASSRCLFYLSTNFDASISDIGTALLAGATLCIEPPCALQPGPEFLHLLKNRQISHIDIPPSVLKLIDAEQLPQHLKTVIIGGEVCPADVVRHWSSKVRLVNVYGPTEATVCTSLNICDPDWKRPLLGDPLPGVYYVVLDYEKREVPDGEPGELYIGGICLAKGYLNQPLLTAQKFISWNGSRLYKSGDRVIRHNKKEYEFLGRIDRQVKVRGMLVEPEEVEAALTEHPAVHRAIVMKRFVGKRSRESLVAFIVLKSTQSADSQEVRSFLQDRLPKWLVPYRFSFISEIPLTATGKADFSVLGTTNLADDTRCDSQLLAADGSNTADVIAAVYAEVLGLRGVGPEDDLFGLGGDSFSIIEAVMLAESCGLTISPHLMMSKPSVIGLANALDAIQYDNHDIAVQAAGGKPASELRVDVALSAEWQQLLRALPRDRTAPATKPGAVLVTGATGFLGSRLLLELLQGTDSQLYCLIRCTSPDDGLIRLNQAISVHGTTLKEEELARIHVLSGDLSEKLLGLPAELWNRLSQEIDTIYHCAAHVNMLLSYEQLRKTNVGGTFEIARFFCAGRQKFLHYASTLSVFVASDLDTGSALEADVLDRTNVVYGGYAQTKWSSEVFLRSLAGSGPICHYRFGLIVGDSESGRTSSTDFLALFSRGIASLGCVPHTDTEVSVDITPIDFAARAMFHLSLKSMTDSQPRTYHIANPHGGAPLGSIVTSLQRAGAQISTVSTTEFSSILQTKKASGLTPAEAAACLALCRVTGAGNRFAQFRTMDLFQATDIKFEMSNTLNALQGLSLVCPAPTAALLLLYAQAALAEEPEAAGITKR